MVDDIFAERPMVQPAFASQSDIESALVHFRQAHSLPEARKLIALGYGPLGDRDPNFNPVFRRRYYLTQKKLRKTLDRLSDHYDDLFSEELKEEMDDFFLDVRWFIKNRKDIHEGSVPSTDRRISGNTAKGSS